MAYPTDTDNDKLSAELLSQGQGKGFDDLDTSQSFLASVIMFLVNFLDPSATGETSGLNKFFAGVFGMEEDQFNGWLSSTRNDPDYNWREDHDFSNFDFDKAGDVVRNQMGGLLDMIAEYESGGDYDVVYGGRDTVEFNGQTREITEMSVNEVLAWQKQSVAHGAPSSAAGRYQIIQGTLKDLKQKMGLSGEEKFDEAMQDRMAMKLLERRGLGQYLDGDMSEQQFMLKLSKEWASLPKDMNGRSYYAGDGLNKALEDPQTVLATLRQARAEHLKGQSNQQEPSTTEGPALKDTFNPAAEGQAPTWSQEDTLIFAQPTTPANPTPT